MKQQQVVGRHSGPLRGRQLTEAAASGTLPPHCKQALAPRFKREKISNIKYKKKDTSLSNPCPQSKMGSWSQAEEILTLDTRHSGAEAGGGIQPVYRGSG